MAYCGPRGIPLSAFLAWQETDQAAALAWLEQERRTCRDCGTHPDDWREDRYAWHAELYRCPGCEHLERLRASDQADGAGRGVKLRLAHGSAAGCARCRPG